MNRTKILAVIGGMLSILFLLTPLAMAADDTIVSIDDASASKGTTTATTIGITGLTAQLGAATVVLNYDTDVEVVGVTPGTMGAITVGIDNVACTTTITWFAASGVTGDQTFAQVELKALGDPGVTSPLDITVNEFTATDFSVIAVGDDDGTFTVEGGALPQKLTATRDISDQTVEAGSTFTVTLTLTASGAVQAPALKENLPAGWTVIEVNNGGATYKPATTEWIWSAAMSSGETRTATYKVNVPASAAQKDYYITGQASAYGVSPITIGGESKVSVYPPGDPISATRDISDQTVEAGSTFTVTLTLTASGDVQAPALKENLPAGWTVTPVNSAGATYKPATTEWVWSAAMSSGETKIVTYKVNVPTSAAPADYYITGQASAHEVGPITIGGESKVTVGPPPKPTPIPPPTPSSEVPILTSFGMFALIAVLCIAGTGMIVNRGRKQ